MRLRIGAIDFDLESGELISVEGTVRLEPQPAAVLARLGARPGELVTHDELRKAVWGEATHVNFQQSLHYCVRQVRLALSRTASSVIVESVPRRGYRLLVPLEPAASPDERRDRSAQARARRWALWAAVAAATVASIAVVERRPNNHHQVAAALMQAVHDFVY